MEAGIPTRLSAAENRRFALSVGGAFVILAGLLWWRGRVTVAAVLAAAGLSLFGLGLLIPARLGPVHRGWWRFALAISKVTTPIILGVIFFGVITPTGLLARALGHRPLARRRATTAWIDRADGARTSDLQRQF